MEYGSLSVNVEQEFREGLAAYDASDFPAATAKLLPLAEGGHAGAQYVVAEMFRWGTGVGQSAELSAKFYRAAADQGHPHAAYSLAMILEPACTVYPPAMQACPKDEAASKHYLGIAAVRSRDLAEAGDVDAMALLGSLFHNGMGVELDGAEAIRWYTRAFEAGRHGAANCLCLAYYEGDVRVRDKAKALFWYKKTKEFDCQCIGIDEFEMQKV